MGKKNLNCLTKLTKEVKRKGNPIFHQNLVNKVK